MNEVKRNWAHLCVRRSAPVELVLLSPTITTVFCSASGNAQATLIIFTTALLTLLSYVQTEMVSYRQRWLRNIPLTLHGVVREHAVIQRCHSVHINKCPTAEAVENQQEWLWPRTTSIPSECGDTVRKMPLHICPNQGNDRISIAGHASCEPVTNEKIPFRLTPKRVVNKRKGKKKRAQSWAEVLTLLLHHKDCHG